MLTFNAKTDFLIGAQERVCIVITNHQSDKPTDLQSATHAALYYEVNWLDNMNTIYYDFLCHIRLINLYIRCLNALIQLLNLCLKFR